MENSSQRTRGKAQLWISAKAARVPRSGPTTPSRIVAKTLIPMLSTAEATAYGNQWRTRPVPLTGQVHRVESDQSQALTHAKTLTAYPAK